MTVHAAMRRISNAVNLPGKPLSPYAVVGEAAAKAFRPASTAVNREAMSARLAACGETHVSAESGEAPG